MSCAQGIYSLQVIITMLTSYTYILHNTITLTFGDSLYRAKLITHFGIFPVEKQQSCKICNIATCTSNILYVIVLLI